MADLYAPFDPWLRVTQYSSVIGGPFPFAVAKPDNSIGGPAFGVWLDSCTVEYVPELRGPWLNTSYSWRWTLLGYRPQIELRVALAKDDTVGGSAMGLALLTNLYTNSFRQSEGVALEFNAYGSNAQSAWRAVMFEGSLSPKKISSKAVVGWEVQFKLKTQALIQQSDIGFWKDSKW